MKQTLEYAAINCKEQMAKENPGASWDCTDVLNAFKAGAEWQKKQFSDILDQWEAHAIEGMKVGASAYHQGKIALICDLRDWIKEQTQKQ